ncbi:MAG: thioredoxin domain-containing protein [Nitrospira sp.]|nr:thioredoxin domain-containing protein [Nitrospira sp.]MDH4369634.1 thioredoxin domain-containing protein [Nitrospira sp.]MDH5497154.1 thioredoxin domain-containing protein [Nitrospira sp.]
MKITSITGIIVGIGGLILLLFTTAPFKLTIPRQSSDSDIKTQVVATVGTRSITLMEVERAVALQLYQVEEQRAKLLNESTQRLIEEELLSAEAARIGVSVPELIERASQSEEIAKLAGLPAPVRLAMQPSQKLTMSLPFQIPKDVSRIRQALLVQLHRKTKIHANLSQPERPVLNVSPDDDPWIGTAQAPITIVEFSDFQCPYCQRSVPILKELLEKYPGKLKLVYRDFPGPNHQHALSAAEAAQCAVEQSRFWEYHDALFASQTPEIGWKFSALAENLGLRQSPFNACMKEHRYREEVLNDLQDGLKLGVTSTPTFFINGRPLVGARPLADFQAIIDPLLKQPSSP